MEGQKCIAVAESEPIIELETVESELVAELVVESEPNSSSKPNSNPEPEYKSEHESTCESTAEPESRTDGCDDLGVAQDTRCLCCYRHSWRRDI